MGASSGSGEAAREASARDPGAVGIRIHERPEHLRATEVALEVRDGRFPRHGRSVLPEARRAHAGEVGAHRALVPPAVAWPPRAHERAAARAAPLPRVGLAGAAAIPLL